MAFKARPPSPFSPFTSDYNSLCDWRKEFDTYVMVTTHFANDVELAVKRARLFNLAGPDFAKFVHQNITLADDTTIDAILNGIGTALKPKRYDLQNRGKLFTHRQSTTSAAKYLEELRQLYYLSNYGATITINFV